MRTGCSVAEHAKARTREVSPARGDGRRIYERLRELDHEWDIERCLETGSSTLTLTGLLLGMTVNRRWLLLSGVVQAFFLQHASQGWCPPLPVLRALGVRTQREIEAERHARKALLGASDRADDGQPPREVVDEAMR